MFSSLKRIFQKEQYHPTLLGIFINPCYFARKELYENIRKFSEYIEGRTLDVGCGQKPYERLFSKAKGYTGFEIDNTLAKANKKVDVFYDGKTFPFENSSFDSVVTFEVFEHVFNPEEFLKEVHRVLKDDGALLMSASFIWGEHEQDHDYARYSSFGLKHLLGKYGFEIVSHRKTASGIRAIFQLITSYIYKVIAVRNAYLTLLFTIVFISPFNILGEILSKILPSNSDLYLDNVILARKSVITQKEACSLS
ncbi:class I SAM-dependent methyltransferase [Candidatus Omnitrophota bacterium]